MVLITCNAGWLHCLALPLDWKSRVRQVTPPFLSVSRELRARLGKPMLRAYLVDDELPALKRLTRLLAATGRVEIVGSTTNPTTAIESISSDLPDVLFLDIQMPGLNGFDLLASLKRQPIVIFTTAYDQYALKAFEVNSVDYLLKPIEPEQLERALRKLEQLQGGQR